MNSCCPTDKLNQQAMDELLEKRIEQARVTMTNAQTQDARREAYEDMRWLISQRSPEQIEKMEKERGLTA